MAISFLPPRTQQIIRFLLGQARVVEMGHTVLVNTGAVHALIMGEFQVGYK
jgi:hypothetical protein